MKSTIIIFLFIVISTTAATAEKIQPDVNGPAAKDAQQGLNAPIQHEVDSGKPEDHKETELENTDDEQPEEFKLHNNDNSDPDHWKVHSLTDGIERFPPLARQFDDFRHRRGRFNDCPFNSYYGCRRFYDCPFDNPWSCFDGRRPRYFGGGPRGPRGPFFGGGPRGPHFGGPHFGRGGPHSRRQEEDEINRGEDTINVPTEPEPHVPHQEDSQNRDNTVNVPGQPEPHPFKNLENEPTALLELPEPNLTAQKQNDGVHEEEAISAEQPDETAPAAAAAAAAKDDMTHEASSFYTFSK